ncbi:hypothetical protein [Streptomyces sp. BA2]|uniref:hypothetical protein n=1 Tax=Streptomyces sp. BA2 TaxID=436595 RepID=UPI0013286EF1|nr:hypothetical protein [Streptomyces sp. BA2]MWA07811.1 hypothetical protein [Streptomyces sp. BA2]
MTTRTVTNASGLRYTLRSTPTFLDTEQVATLTLTATNDSDQPIDCPSISLGFPLTPQGPDTTVLTTSPETIHAAVSQGFTLTAGSGAYTLTPSTTLARLAPGDHFTLTLDNIQPPTAPGVAPLHLTEGSDPAAQISYPLPVVFWPGGDQGIFEGFRADDAPVQRGNSTTLHWRCAANPKIHYTLYYNTGSTAGDLPPVTDSELRNPANYTAEQDSNILDFSYTTEPLYSIAIGYHLQATWQEEARYQTTASFVIGGDLDTGDINVKGNAGILHPVGQTALTAGTVYTAPTDGFLFGSVTANNNNVQSTLTAQIAPRGALQSAVHAITSESASDEDNHNFTIPVSKCSTLQFTVPYDADCYRLIWQPLGDGDLVEGTGTDCLSWRNPHSAASAPPPSPAGRSGTADGGRRHRPAKDSGWPTGDKGVFEDFHPDDLPVSAGATTNLHWHCSQNTDIEYDLYYNTTDPQQGVVQVHVADADLRNPSNSYFTPDPADAELWYFTVPTQPLNGLTIGYHLQATHTPSGEIKSQTTASVITDGDLTAGNLTASGHAGILHTSSDTFDIGTAYTALSDGFIFAALNQDCSGNLQAQITSGSTVSTATLTGQSGSTQDNNKNFTFPVRKSSTVEFTVLPNDPSDYMLTWLPLGTGKLA